MQQSFNIFFFKRNSLFLKSLVKIFRKKKNFKNQKFKSEYKKKFFIFHNNYEILKNQIHIFRTKFLNWFYIRGI